MLNLTANDLLQLKGSGGKPFTEFVDRLIRAEAHAGGLPQSEIDTQARVNVGDGGVDTRVRKAVPLDKSGYLAEPTCWQYKSETLSELTNRGTKKEPLRFLTEEVQKSEVRALIALGSAFRFCILGDLTPETLREWEGHLIIECKKISSNASVPRVVAADKLCAWAERFPATISFLVKFPEELFNLDAWRARVQAVTPEYVPIENWAVTAEAITQHAKAAKVVNPCLSIQGAAGVGKTRLVFECLALLPESEALVVYTSNEQLARTFSEQLANSNAAPHAIVVADECSLQSRTAIHETIAGCKDRVRYICLSNLGLKGATDAPEHWLEEMPQTAVEKILARNYPEVPLERRIAYAKLSGGFIRLSADMCSNNERLTAAGHLGPILVQVEEYVRLRLDSDEDKAVLDSLALFTVVGAKAQLAPQVECLCAITGIAKQRFVEIAERIKDSPGFISIEGRYFYVTPAIIAQIAFARGWKRWVRDNLKTFLDQLHPDLLQPFYDRVRMDATEEVKAALAGTFREWITARKPEDLTDPIQVEHLAKFVETDPSRFLPQLRSLVERAPPEILKSGSQFGSSPRRHLVWLCERLAAFPEYYEDCESILFRLAVNESEPKIGNNATAIWCQLHRIFLSGSSLDFVQRFAKLQGRAAKADASELALCMRATCGILSNDASRMGAPATIGGRLRPEDWQPKTNKENHECWVLVLQFLNRLIRGDDQDKSIAAMDLVVDEVLAFLHVGLLKMLQTVLATAIEDTERLSRIIESVETFIDGESGRVGAIDAEGEYVFDVRAWLKTISPRSFSGRIRTLVSRAPWHDSLQSIDGKFTPELMELASHASEHPDDLESAISFLTSDGAQAAAVFGDALGRSDTGQKVLEIVLSSVKPGANIQLARGYVFGSVRGHEKVTQELIDHLNDLAVEDTKAAFELRMAGGKNLDALNFALEGVDKGKLAPIVLTQFAYGFDLSPAQIKEVLRRLVEALGSREVNRASVQFLSAVWHGDVRASELSSIDDAETRSLAWDILQSASDDLTLNLLYSRANLVEKLAIFDTVRSVSFLLGSLLARQHASTHDHELRALISIAKRQPEQVMEVFGPAMVKREHRLVLSAGKAATAVLQALPIETVVKWIRREGIESASVVAANLPRPYIDGTNAPIVPLLTLAVLEEFGGDENVCKSFSHNAVNVESWWGNGGEHFRAKAAVAQRFLPHTNRCIRSWAEREVARCEAIAKREQIQYEERMIEP